MGRKALFNQQEVFTAADALAAEGKEVTANALLGKLGGGSLTTIYKHLNDWKAANPDVASQSTPIDIPDPVQGAFAAAWRAAVTEAAKEIAAVKEKAAEEVKAANKQFNEALQSIERLEGEAETDAARIEDLEKNVKQLEDGLHQSENDRAALKAASDQQQQRIEALDAELKRLRTEMDSERAKQEEARRERETLIKESSELRGQVEALKTQNNELLSRLGPKSK